MDVKVEVTSKTAFQVLTCTAHLKIFTLIFQTFNAGFNMIPVRSELPNQRFNQLFPNRFDIRTDLRTLFGHIRTRMHIGRVRTMGGCDLVTSLAFGSYSTIYELFSLQESYSS